MEVELMEALFRGAVGGGFLFLVAFTIVKLSQFGIKKGKQGFEKAKEVSIQGVEFAKGQMKSEAQKIADMDEKFILIAQNEIDQDNQDESLWIKANLLSGGDQVKRKIEYIKLRVKKLSS
tara:strand:- start:263 stop:622 length:360 start_codon:yes stop_codon:yes gene_type:complete